MEKVIIVLTGYPEGKTQFVNTIKENGYWTWNVNHLNRLASLTHSLGWDGERDELYREFIKKFEFIANEYFDFKNEYVEKLIIKFLDNERATTLIVHGADTEMSKRLQEKYINCFSIHITDNDEFDGEFCKILNYKDENYIKNVLVVMTALTTDIENLKEKDATSD